MVHGVEVASAVASTVAVLVDPPVVAEGGGGPEVAVIVGTPLVGVRVAEGRGGPEVAVVLGMTPVVGVRVGVVNGGVPVGLEVAQGIPAWTVMVPSMPGECRVHS
jgi:hypothetical protein